MATFRGGTRVGTGYYIDARSYAFVNVERDGTVLPGDADRKYVKVPVVAVMAAAPALGGLFVVALPFIGVGMTAYAIAKRLGHAARSGAREVAATVAAPATVPGRAHLAGQPPSSAGPAPAADAQPAATSAKEDSTAALEKEIEAQRGVVH